MFSWGVVVRVPTGLATKVTLINQKIQQWGFLKMTIHHRKLDKWDPAFGPYPILKTT
jgi:hypothetical protein